MGKIALRIEELVQQGPLGRSSIFGAIRDGRLKAKKYGKATIVLDADWRGFLEDLPPVDSLLGKQKALETERAALAKREAVPADQELPSKPAPPIQRSARGRKGERGPDVALGG
jgi:hypothetical protein